MKSTCLQVAGCAPELEVQVGCECVTKEQCGAAVNMLPADCLQTLVTIQCNEAYWIDEQMGVNLRGIVMHLGNDCGGLSLSCPPDVRPRCSSRLLWSLILRFSPQGGGLFGLGA